MNCARLRYTASQALAYRAQDTPESKMAIHDYFEAVAPATVIALLDEYERHQALISDLLKESGAHHHR